MSGASKYLLELCVRSQGRVVHPYRGSNLGAGPFGLEGSGFRANDKHKTCERVGHLFFCTFLVTPLGGFARNAFNSQTLFLT